MKKLLLLITIQTFTIPTLCAARQHKSAELKTKLSAPQQKQSQEPTAFNTLRVAGVEKEGRLTRYIIQNIHTGNITILSLPTFTDSTEKTDH